MPGYKHRIQLRGDGGSEALHGRFLMTENALHYAWRNSRVIGGRRNRHYMMKRLYVNTCLSSNWRVDIETHVVERSQTPPHTQQYLRSCSTRRERASYVGLRHKMFKVEGHADAAEDARATVVADFVRGDRVGR
jgi:hypothetical protein